MLAFYVGFWLNIDIHMIADIMRLIGSCCYVSGERHMPERISRLYIIWHHVLFIQCGCTDTAWPILGVVHITKWLPVAYVCVYILWIFVTSLKFVIVDTSTKNKYKVVNKSNTVCLRIPIVVRAIALAFVRRWTDRTLTLLKSDAQC